MTEQTRVVGSFFSWIQARIAVVAILGFAIAAARDIGTLVFCGVIFVAAVIMCHRVVWASADENGLYVKRYVRTHFVPWSEVLSIERRRWWVSNVSVEFAVPIAYSNYAEMTMPGTVLSPVSEHIRSALRGEDPELVVWMRQQMEASRTTASFNASSPSRGSRRGQRGR